MAGQVILITGAGSGIGRHLLTAFPEARILATDVDETRLQAACDALPTGREVRAQALDVRDPLAWAAAVESAVQTWGRLDLLLNVAGVIQPGYVAEITPQAVDLHLDVNTKGVIYGTKAALDVMLTQTPIDGWRGQIINFASLAGVAPIMGIGLYSASKHAVRAFSLAAGMESRSQGVAVTVICPDAVQTPMLDLQVAYPQAALTFSGGRVLTVEEVAGAVRRAIAQRPLEITLPRSRGWTAKIANLLPAVAYRLAHRMAEQGRHKQESRKHAPSR